MVTKYSGRSGSVKGRTKLVLTYSPTTVKNSTSSVKVTAKLYYESTYRTQDSFNTAKISGSLGSWSGDMSINGTSVHIKTITKNVSTSYSGSKKITVSASLSGVEASPGSHSVSASITIPKRPVAKPYTPSNVNMALLSDNRMKTTWSHSTSTARPVSSYTVQYQRLDGGSWTGWMHSATVKGKSYTSNPGVNNKSYRRRVRANNSAGSSSWAYSNYVRMQPYAPVNVRAKVLPSGDDIQVTWDFNSPAESTCLSLQLQRRVNGGSWATINSSFGQVKSKPYTSSYTDTAPGNGSNQYRIRILNSCEGDDSVWSESNTVSTIVPPKAPTNLSPDGNVVDFTTDVKFTWQHHDAGDGADQTHYDLRYRAEGESAWTYAPDGGNTSDVSEHLFEAGELENGVNYEWQVRTQGNTKESFGPWSKSAFVTGWTAPVVAIKDGAPPNPLTALPLPVAWTYAQDEGQSQIAWEARVYSLGAGDSFDAIIDRKSAESSSNETTFSTALRDGERYGVTVRARSSQGQWSEWSETTFDVELLVPAELRVVLDYNESTGQMNLNITSDEPVQGETAEVVEVNVDRRINGGEWTPIMVGIPFDTETTLVDNTPSIWGVNEYRVTASTNAPSKGVFGPFRKTVTPYIGNTENWLFLNYGETFDQLLRMQGDLSMSGSYDRSKETQKLLGRKKPISLLGQQLSREHQVSGTVEFREQCVDDVPDIPAELVGSVFFDDARAWNFSKVQAGPDSQITADAHYRAKRYGYLMDVPEGNTTDLVSPSPRSGVPGTEIPGREVEEVTARNLWRGSKLSEDRSAISVSGNYSAEQVDDGLRITGISDPGTGAISLTWTSTGGLVTDLPKSGSLSLTVPLRNDGTVPIPVRVAMWTRDSSGATLTTGVDYGHVMMPGEIYLAKVEAQELTERSYDARYSMYYGTNAERPIVGSVFTVLDGITLVQDDVAADPFNGDGAQKQDELVRRNLLNYPVGDRATGRTGWRISGSEVHEFIADDGGNPAIEARDEVGGGQLYIDPNTTFTPAKGQWIAFGVDVKALDEERAEKMKLSISAYSGTELANSSPITPVTTDSYTRITTARQVTAAPDGGYVRTLIWPTNVDAPGGFRFRHAVVAIADSEDEALSAVRTYFDGDSQDNGMFRYEYEGEPGQSASLEYRVADVLRRNRATNGALHDDEKWWSYSLSPSDSVIVERVEGGPVGDHYRRITLDGVDATSSGGIYYRDSEVSGRGGDVVSVGVWVKQTAGTRFRLSLAARKGGSNVGNGEGGYLDATGDWQWVTSTGMEIKSDYDYVQVWVVAISPTAGFEQSMTGVTIVDGYDAPESFFDSHTSDTYNRLYRRAPDGSSIELVTDTQSLYRWAGAEAVSESEKYLPAAPAHFDEYSEWLNVEPSTAYELSAFVSAPGLRSLARRNLTSQGQFVTDRKLWGSSEVSGAWANWTDDSMFENGAVELSAMRTGGLTFRPTAYLGTGVRASTLGIATLSGASLTIGVDVYAEEAPNADQRVYIRALDSAGDMIGDVLKHSFRATDAIDRYVMRVTLPEGTESFDLRFDHSATNTIVYASNFTVENDVTDGSWIDDSESGREWVGAENIDSVLLMIESFDSSGESLGTETVAELQPDEFSNRWRTLTGEYVSAVEVATARVWVQWVVNGEHPDLQSDWYFGGMSSRVLYTVPERWPGPDSNPDEWRNAQYESTTVCLRTPSGHRVFGAMSGLEITAVEGDLDLAEVSFTVTETDYTENPMVIDESDIWDNIVLDPHDDSFVVQPGEIETQPGWGNIVINPYSESDA